MHTHAALSASPSGAARSCSRFVSAAVGPLRELPPAGHPRRAEARTNTTLRSLNRAVIVVVAPLAGILADAWGIRPMLVLAAGIFALAAAGLGASSFRDVRAPA